MSQEELAKLIALALQAMAFATSQYEKYKQEQNLDDAGMKLHLKDLNKEDADAFDAIIAANTPAPT